MIDPIRYTEYRIMLNHIKAITSLYENESFIADTVLHDWNLDPENVAFALKHIEKSREEYLRDNPDAKSANVDEIVRFLYALQVMGEDFLDGLAGFVDEWREGKHVL